LKISYLGHACFMLEGNKTIIIDPFLSGNPLAAKKPEEIKVDYILVSHGHGDHLGDAIEIAKRSAGTIITSNELAVYCGRKGAKVHKMHLGGAYDFGGLKVKLTPAWHGSAVVDDRDIIYTGVPCGFLIWMDGLCIYHAGDTALFGDMDKVIGKYNKIDLALLPIGDNFTMGPEDAVIAAGWLGAKTVIPMHYNTWPLITQDPNLFKKSVEANTTSKCVVLKPGENMDL
jgi:L-ascorbate metabolism protein UlaG (beta-lactamase superfamily)